MSDHSWRTWAEQLATGLVLVDADLRLCWINPAVSERLELGLRSPLGRPLSLLFVDAPQIMEQAAKLLKEQRSAHWRAVPLAALDHREISADISVQPCDDGLLLEIHVLPEAASTVSPLSATLRGFAHEVKNPLAGLRGAAQLLQRRVDNEDLRALAGLIIDEADRLGALSNRLLHHDGAAQLGPVNIHQLLERIADLLRAEPHPPRLRQDYDPSLPELHGDADRLQQVLLNLARNALEAGARTLTLRTRAEHGLRLGDAVPRLALRVDVADDGPGVPAELRETLFEPLVSGRVDGTGLGLALSREIAHEHGGELRFTSRAGDTVFSLYLPLELGHD